MTGDAGRIVAMAIDGTKCLGFEIFVQNFSAIEQRCLDVIKGC